MRGLGRAEAAGVDAIAVFTAATDAFTQHNIGMTVDESLAAFAPVLARAGELGWWRRAYVSTAFGCPYTGRVDPAPAVEVARPAARRSASTRSASGTRSVSASRTRSPSWSRSPRPPASPLERQAYHFHDTRGTALANVAAGLAAGIRTFDSSTGGTGGCPYAPGAAGNLATEDLVYFLDASGWEHGVSLDGVLAAAGSSPTRSESRSRRRSARPAAGIRRRVPPTGR